MKKKCLVISTVLGIVWLLTGTFFVYQGLKFQKKTAGLNARQKEFIEHEHKLFIRVDRLSQDLKIVGASGESCKVADVKVDQAHVGTNVAPTYHQFEIHCKANLETF